VKDNQNYDRISRSPWKASHYGVGLCLLIAGFLFGRVFFPGQISKPVIVEREKRVEIPVERIVEKKVPFEVIKFTDRVVEKRVEIPVERIVYRDIAVGVDGVRANVDLAAWRSLSKGQSKSQVIAALGHPVRIRNGPYEELYYSDRFAYASVTFFNEVIFSWSVP
jgi:hypothetical protein